MAEEMVSPSIIDEARAGVVIIMMWALLSLGLNFYNKWVLTPTEYGGEGFTFPMFYTATHMMTSFLGSSLIFIVAPSTNTVSLGQFQRHWKPLLMLSALEVVRLGCSNASLIYIGLSVNLALKSIGPLPTMVLSIFFEGRNYSWQIVMAVGAQVIGAVLVVPFGTDEATPYGMLLATLAMFAGALRPVTAAILMRDSEMTGVTPLVVCFYDTLVSMGALMLLWACSDERDDTLSFISQKPRAAFGFCIAGAFMGFFYNLVVLYFTKVTSALTNVVLATFEHVILIFLAVVYDRINRTASWLGFGIFSVATIAYALISIIDPRAGLRGVNARYRPGTEPEGYIDPSIAVSKGSADAEAAVEADQQYHAGRGKDKGGDVPTERSPLVN